jgi:catechol 2,3-dioxygenase-like lactoylglutathione lyase family enzyme
MNITGVDFAVIQTRDFDRAIEFYGGTLGLPELKRYGKSPGIEFQAGNLTVAVLEIEKFGQPFTVSRSPLAFQVDDVPTARAELEGKGVEFQGDIVDSGVCHQAYFDDPDGNALILHHRYA